VPFTGQLRNLLVSAMFKQRSLKWPITLGVVLIVLIVVITIGWVVLAIFGAHWVWLVVGCSLLALMLGAVVMYLVFSIQEVNLNRRQLNFMDSITHELKSPIASLKLYLQTLTMRQVNQEERENFHRYMLDDVERLDLLINHMLVAAQLEKKEQPQATEDVEVSDVLRNCAKSVCLQYRVPLDRVEFNLQPCFVKARAVDVDMICRNLIDNAVKYAASEPHVEISLHAATADTVVLRVADNGRGIPANMRRKIFGRFVRLGFELHRDKPGTGLGLHIVNTLIRRLRGRIKVREQTNGPGAVFEVHLPGQAAKPADASEGAPDAGYDAAEL